MGKSSQGQPDLSIIQRFVECAMQGNDDEAETLCHQFSVSHGPALIQLSQASLAMLQKVGLADQSLTEDQLLDLRWWSIRGLANCGDEQTIAPLAIWLADHNPEIRGVAALALGHIGRRLTPELLSEDELGWSAVLAAIGKLLDDPTGSVRQAAADTLVMLEETSLPTLRHVLENGSESARVRAAYALRKIGTQGRNPMAAAPGLFQILNDSNYLVHTYAQEALDEMGLLDNVIVTL